MITNKEYNKRVLFKYLIYSLGIVLGVFLVLWLFRVTNFYIFLGNIENSSFDGRQKIISEHKVANKDIVIITVDNASYEYLVEKYGEWPMPRKVYADIADYVESQKPAALAFDFMFVNSLKSSYYNDSYLVERFKKYDNLYTAINFDNLDSQIRRPEALPDKLSVNINNNSKINFKSPAVNFSNCRGILKEIINATSNIGHINLMREDDGIARNIAPFVLYQGKYYPHMALKVAMDYLAKTEDIDTKNLTIDKNGNLLLGKRKLPMTKNGTLFMNWYGSSGEYNDNSFIYIPIWKLEKLAYGENVEDAQWIKNNFFTDKIVYVGVSATSMYDIKSTPTERNMPGVELHTTFINNILDNNFIYRAPMLVDLLITLFLSIIVGIVVLRFESTVVSSLMSSMISILYMLIALYIMKEFNIWISIVFPLAFVLLTFIGVFLVKYFRKSKDFEHTYKLATTDGLTELYNHRYFQEQMILNIEHSKRYNSSFSLILIDIDFFKKFNDKFGHQSGDAVLKQVAQTLKKNVRTTDIVCRYGGEEMSVILSNTKKEEAIFTAQKLCDAVAGRIFDLANNQKEHVTISLGVATYPEDGDSPQAIIECSDKGLYKAKENGRNQVGVVNK